MTRCKMTVMSKSEDGVRLEPVYDGAPNSENGKFFQATPGGFCELSIMNKAALDQFEVNKEYLVDFTKVVV